MADAKDQPAPKKRYSDSKNRTFISLSFSAPAEMEDSIKEAAAAKGMNRSQYIVWLIERDIYMARGLKADFDFGQARTRKVPPRVHRKKKKPKE